MSSATVVIGALRVKVRVPTSATLHGCFECTVDTFNIRATMLEQTAKIKSFDQDIHWFGIYSHIFDPLSGKGNNGLP